MKITIAFVVGLLIGVAAGVQYEVVGMKIGTCEAFCAYEVDVDGCVGIGASGSCWSPPNSKLEVDWGEK